MSSSYLYCVDYHQMLGRDVWGRTTIKRSKSVTHYLNDRLQKARTIFGTDLQENTLMFLTRKVLYPAVLMAQKILQV